MLHLMHFINLLFMEYWDTGVTIEIAVAFSQPSNNPSLQYPDTPSSTDHYMACITRLALSFLIVLFYYACRLIHAHKTHTPAGSPGRKEA